MGHFREGVADDDSVAWEEEQSRTVAPKQLQLFSISWGPRKKAASRQTAGLSPSQRTEPSLEASGPGAEGLADSQCGGFTAGRSTVLLGQGAVQEVREEAEHRGVSWLLFLSLVGVGWTGRWRAGVQVTGHLKWHRKAEKLYRRQLEAEQAVCTVSGGSGVPVTAA